MTAVVGRPHKGCHRNDSTQLLNDYGEVKLDVGFSWAATKLSRARNFPSNLTVFEVELTSYKGICSSSRCGRKESGPNTYCGDVSDPFGLKVSNGIRVSSFGSIHQMMSRIPESSKCKRTKG